jgi:succinoglycan biosynthesis protein ExoA
MSAAGGERPDISIVMPVRNEARFIEATLRQLVEQEIERDRFEIIVCDGESDDDTAEIVRRFASNAPGVAISLIRNSARYSSAGRNLGVRAARGKYVLIIDGHVQIPSQTLLRDAYELAISHGAIVLGRPQRLSPNGLSVIQHLVAEVRASSLGHSAESHVFSEIEGWVAPGSIGVMYLREAFEKYGLFDERFDAAEDYEFNTRLEDSGVLCYTSPRLEVLYFPRSSIRGLFYQMLRYGIGRGRMARKQKKIRSLASILPAIAVVAGVVLLATSLFWPPASWVLAGLIVSYFALIFLVRARNTGLRRFPLLKVLAAFTAVHAGAGVGFLLGICRPLGPLRATSSRITHVKSDT